MAQFACMACGHEGHFVEFKTGSHTEHDEDIDEDIEVDEVECPDCGSASVVEL
jgi:DNA-directed RNA polymerase subunit RPC12/RpoP